MTIKADMEKAYDRVEWPFLIILQQLDFHLTWINWISKCISSSIFSILLNGSPFGRFTLLGSSSRRFTIAFTIFVVLENTITASLAG